MQPIQARHTENSRLRLVFNDTVVSLSLAAHATFGEVALALADHSDHRYGDAVAIDVTFGERNHGSI